MLRTPWSRIGEVLTSETSLTALRLSLIVATTAAAISFVLGFPLAWVLVRTTFPGKTFVRAVVILPLVMPPVVAGVGLLAAFGRRSGLIGSWLYEWFGIQLTFTTAAAVLAATFVSFPLAVLALEAGLRFLPTTVVIAVIAPLAGRLSDRFGPVWPMGTGLAILSVSMYLFSLIDISTTYNGLILPFVLMGAGIALVMSPMSTAAMNAVSVQKAGVASGVLQMSRMVGGTVGVAATGAIFQSLLGSGFDPASLIEAPDAAQAAFVDALSSAMLLAAVVSVIGFVVAVAMIRGGSAKSPSDAARRDAAAPTAAAAADLG